SRLAAKLLDSRDHALSGNAGNRRLAGRVDVQNEDAVGVRESGTEFFEQIGGSRIAVRLEDHVDRFELTLPRRSQRCASVRWVMAVVGDHADVGKPAAQLETPVNALKALQALPDQVRRNVQAHTHAHGGGGIQHVVMAGNLEVEVAQAPSLIVHLKMGNVL